MTSLSLHQTLAAGLLLLVMASAASPATARTWFIQPGGGGDAATIQAGIDSAAAGDTVLLAAGTFTGDGNRDIDFKGKAIVLTSVSGPQATIIDCEEQARGFNFQNGETRATVLSGITLIHADPGKSAGGIFCTGASPTIDNCVLRDITIDSNAVGGALFCVSFANPLVTRTHFVDNAAGFGGALWCGDGSQPVFEDCVFENNSALLDGGAIFCVSFGRATFNRCTIAENTAGNLGTDVFMRDASPVFTQTIISSSLGGDMIYCDVGAAPSFNCCDIFGTMSGAHAPDLNGSDNIFDDPLFCGVDGSGNYFLQSTSPAAAANSPCGLLIGAYDVGCGTTASKAKTWGSLKNMYGGGD